MRLVNALALACVLSAGAVASASVSADLNADWSNTSNPNSGAFGTWSYNMGDTPLTSQNSLSGFVNQPGWGTPQNAVGDFLPLMYKDAQSGDVLIHSTDPINGVTNGVENGPANVKWISPVTETARISGSVWSPAVTDNGRTQDFELILNPGPSQQIMVPTTPIPELVATRDNPLTFDFPNTSLHTGDVLELLLTEDPGSPFGGITSVQFFVPEPAALLILGAGALVVSGLRRRRE